MRILWVKYGEILPVDTGGKLRSFHLLRHLAAQAEVTFFSYVSTDVGPDYAAQLGAAIRGSIVHVAPDLARWREPSLAAVWRTATTGAPLNVTRFTAPSVRARLAELLSVGRFDLLICDFLTPTLNLPPRLAIPAVLFEHNVESALWARRTATIGNPVLRGLYRLEAAATLRWERMMLRRFDATLAVSATDAAGLKRLVPESMIEIVETGVDTAAFASPGTPREDDLLVFVGSMDWQPNEDGVSWFLEAIWPLVRARRPAARFRVVGRRPSARLLALVGEVPGLEVTGDVPDVAPHFHEATLSVVPLRAGGGTRLKIYEAMAGGAPVVSTQVGAEGLDVTDGRDILLADAPGAMAEAICGLLEDPVGRERMRAAALDTVRTQDWSAVASRLLLALHDVRDRAVRKQG